MIVQLATPFTKLCCLMPQHATAIGVSLLAPLVPLVILGDFGDFWEMPDAGNSPRFQLSTAFCGSRDGLREFVRYLLGWSQSRIGFLLNPLYFMRASGPLPRYESLSSDFLGSTARSAFDTGM